MQTKKAYTIRRLNTTPTISIITVQIPTFIYPLLKRRNITSNGIRLPVNYIKFGTGKIMMNNIFGPSIPRIPLKPFPYPL